MSSNWMLQSQEFNPGKLQHFGSHPQTTCFKTTASREITGNLTFQNPRKKMHKLYDCIKTPLKLFLTCLTFHREEMQFLHLHKRTNTGSAPDFVFVIHYWVILGSVNNKIIHKSKQKPIILSDIFCRNFKYLELLC